MGLGHGGLIVQKFGGTSVADGARIRLCAQRAIDAHNAGWRVVVVVSAMGRTTDALVRTALEIERRPPPREMDQLLAAGEQVSVALSAISIHALGGRAVGLDARQAGIVADGAHGRARIASVRTGRIEAVLASGAIAVVAGFQGELEAGDRATIGRGGSDTTAVAVAAALGADLCEINTDTPGVMTADPALVPDARCIPALSWPDMALAAGYGARVVAHDAALLAERHRLPLRIRHAALAGSSTLVSGSDRAAGPLACLATKDTDGFAVAVVGSRLSDEELRSAGAILGPTAAREGGAMVRRGTSDEEAAGLLRRLHAGLGL